MIAEVNEQVKEAVLEIDKLLSILGLKIDFCDCITSELIAYIRIDRMPIGFIRLGMENPKWLSYHHRDFFHLEKEELCIQTVVEEPVMINSINPISKNQVLKCRNEEGEWLIEIRDGEILKKPLEKIKKLGEMR